MHQLPAEVWIEIFSYLDNASMWNVMRVCKLWSDILSNSSKLMNNFELKVNKAFFDRKDYVDLPRVAVRRVLIDDLNIVGGVEKEKATSSLLNHFLNMLPSQSAANTVQLNAVIAIVDKFQNSIENISLKKVTFGGIDKLHKLLNNLSSLKHLRVDDVNFTQQSASPTLKFKHLQTVSMVKDNSFGQSIEDILKLLRHNHSIEKIELCVAEWTPNGFNHDSFNEVVNTMPNVRHLVMKGTGTASFFDRDHFPFKLERLEAYLIGFDWHVTQPRLDFLRTQVGSLKELKLERLPYDYDGGAVLKYIIEEMNLKTFHYGDIALILDGQKQQVDEVWFNEVTVSAGLELLKQFPRIKKLRMWLCATGTFSGYVPQIIGQHTNTFANLQELKLVDNSGGCHELPKFVAIYKNCRNIQKLIVESNERGLGQYFRDFLPFMNRLAELWLDGNDVDLDEKLTAIRESCLVLRKLKLRAAQVSAARDAFEGSDVVIESL